MSDDDEKTQNELDEIREKIKTDKIFNNGYREGDGLRDEDEYEHHSSISVHSNYSDKYLKNEYEYEEALDYNIGVSKIFEVIEGDSDLRSLLHKIDEDEKIKLSKEEINWCFKRILKNIRNVSDIENFYSPIYIVEVMSSILNINSSDPIKDYKKIFDCLDADIQEELIIELNSKYNFLEGKTNRDSIH